MNTIQQSIELLAKPNNRVYGELVRVVQTYTRKDCIELGIEYDPWKHILCDIELIKDGSIMYDVRFTSEVLPYDSTKTYQENVQLQQNTIADGSDTSILRSSATVLLNVPKKSSYAFLQYLDEENGYLALSSGSDTNVLGQANGARLILNVENGSRNLLLENADEFKIMFNNGSYFLLRSDKSVNTVGMQVFIDDVIQLMTKHQSFLKISSDKIEIAAENSSKISIHNSQTDLKADIIEPLCQALIDYGNDINQNFISSGGTGFCIQPQVIQKFQTILQNVSKLLV